MPRHPFRRALAALILAALWDCKVERLRHTDSAAASIAPDSGTSAPESATSLDTSVDTPAVTVPSVPSSAATDGKSTTSPKDTSAIEATPNELAELAAHLVMPIEGIRPLDLRDTYNERRGDGTRPHEALDIPAPRGTPVLSATDGVLRKLHSSVAGGLMVYAADASDRFILMYGHLDRYADGLVEGQPLRSGQVIGYVGTTGNAPANTPHLHFAIARGRPSVAWWRGTPANPYPLLTGASRRP
jgi:peptidoglycan LD-endopeptidase LytH